ncbi:hypothetical protein SteCoe_16022 [Stentor coeruleus]|uniref:Uncharacterized protein n=1 Tax=Stentor coeruleus TaxID=5963 RepID=A0A1R2C231_9CILI|nr:hypothetical protein SteCoe_16022 [Stentor coeruleus]
MKLEKYLRKNPISQHEFLSLMAAIITAMEKHNVSSFPVTKDMIEVHKSHDPVEFEIQFIGTYENNSETEKNDSINVSHLVNFMIDTLLIKVPYNNSKLDAINSLPIAEEIKSLLQLSSRQGSIVTLKMLMAKLKDLNERCQKYRIMVFSNELQVEARDLGASSMPKFIGQSSERKRDREDLKICNYCGFLSLENMIELSECKCLFHIECFEKAVVSSIEAKELGGSVYQKILCSNSENHFHPYDMTLIVEMEKVGFTVSKPIKEMMKYYYLNHLTKCNFCNCRMDHKKVEVNSKAPYRLCNARCSYCGERWHGDEECPEYMKALNWS